MLYEIVKPLVGMLARLLFGLRGRGIEHVPSQGGVMLVANHSSVLDPPLVGVVLPRQLSFLAKVGLFRIPLFGWLIRRLNARPIRREGADPGALRMALRMLGEGRMLLIFPEGTRGREGVLRAPKPGAGMLAVVSGAPVVPVYIAGSGRAWPRGRRLPRPGKVVVTFGPAMRFERGTEGDRKHDYDAASRAMMDAIARLGAIASPATASDPSRPEIGELEAVGGARASDARSKSTDGRTRQHEP
jgi:1-acyl-sn-glycerol-3-phosphate acyltransferase